MYKKGRRDIDVILGVGGGIMRSCNHAKPHVLKTQEHA